MGTKYGHQRKHVRSNKRKSWKAGSGKLRLSKTKRLWYSNYLRAKRMGYLNAPDLREAYALGVISEQEYVKQLKKIKRHPRGY